MLDQGSLCGLHGENHTALLDEELNGIRNQELGHGEELRDICVTMGTNWTRGGSIT